MNRVNPKTFKGICSDMFLFVNVTGFTFSIAQSILSAQDLKSVGISEVCRFICRFFDKTILKTTANKGFPAQTTKLHLLT